MEAADCPTVTATIKGPIQPHWGTNFNSFGRSNSNLSTKFVTALGSMETKRQLMSKLTTGLDAAIFIDRKSKSSSKNSPEEDEAGRQLP
ncbi:hypothetical protein EJB05_07661 [Eragrostis curvula]|uniref:Uncharacterized protein n=1 Tax=Eragrostis curvula TaxID=38414 RepID=A0A5J9WIC7_9POAL|nr:hypothetical protein EJB05_07661 [Eragrostis curvula]